MRPRRIPYASEEIRRSATGPERFDDQVLRLLDPDRPVAARLSVGEARALGEAALASIGYGEDDACIITDQLIDNALCGYRFAGLPRNPRDRA